MIALPPDAYAVNIAQRFSRTCRAHADQAGRIALM